MCKLMEIQKSRTTFNHPTCKSQVEGVNNHLAAYLGDFVSNNTLDWETFILVMAFAINNTP
jgi:hypothetical protein